MVSTHASVILGIHGRTSTPDRGSVHDAGAALVVDGKVLAAVNEERLSRDKNHGGFPHKSIATVLELGGIAPEELDAVVMAAHDLPQLGRRVCEFQLRTLLETGAFSPRRFGGALRDCVLRRHRHGPSWADPSIVHFVEHHQAHAASAYYTCPWPEATVVTVDGVGDELCATVSRAADGRIERLWSCSGYHSPGLLYSAMTHGLGFKKNRHEGKVTGLAAHGNPETLLPTFRALIRYDRSRRTFVAPAISRLYGDLDNNTKQLDELARAGKPADVAAAVQTVTEELITALCADAVRATGSGYLAVAGGIFANVKLNQRLMALDGVDDIYVFPNMGDGGLAVGAALDFAARHKRRLPHALDHVYLGPSWSDDDIHDILQRQGRKFAASSRIEADIANLLAEGRVVGRFAGRMEFGPRALGNRSILVTPSDMSVNDWLNDRLKRTEFMPFAPSTLDRHAADFYVGWRSEHVAARFMTITYDVTPAARASGPATVHVDDTARPQVVRRQDNPSYYALIDAFRECTGIPLLINTSFNMHEEPIVCSPEDALRAFDQGSVDVLAIGTFLVTG